MLFFQEGKLGTCLNICIFRDPLSSKIVIIEFSAAKRRLALLNPEIEVVIVAVTEPLLDSMTMMLVDGDLQFLHLAHLPL